MHTTYYPDNWWTALIPNNITPLPQELIELISSFITFRSRQLNTIFKRDVLDKSTTFTLYAIENQDTFKSALTYAVSIRGSGWNIPLNDPWFCGSQASTPIRYIRGTPVPLWWIRHLSVDWSAPFYTLGSRYFHCSQSCWDNGIGSCRNAPINTYCRCSWITDEVWGHGPHPKTYPPIMDNGDELTYRKNLHSMALSKYYLDNTCYGLSVLSQPTHPLNNPDWQNHQIQNPTLDCPLCVTQLRTAFGKDAFKYSAKCVYTRPRTNNTYIEHIGWTTYPPQLKKHIPPPPRLRRKLRKNNKLTKPNRRISKQPRS